MCLSLISFEASDCGAITLPRKRLRHKYFPVNFVNFLRTPPLKNTSGRLILSLSLETPNFLFSLQLFRCLFIDALVHLA